MLDESTLLIIGAAVVVVILVAYLIHTKKIAALTAQIDERARGQYQTWRERDYQTLVSQQSSVAKREALTELNQWKVDYEAGIRQDAIERSRAVIVGKVTEHLIPHMSVFPYNPKDARFIGSPIDLLVFDGCDEGSIREIVFLEIKTGTSGLSVRQRQIREAVEQGRIVWRVLKV